MSDRGAARSLLKALACGAAGAIVVLLVIGVAYLNAQADLAPWHRVVLDGEYTADTDVATFAEYVALEDRLFEQLEATVYRDAARSGAERLNRYRHGSLADPQGVDPDWNRSFEWQPAEPQAAVLLLHGMSDSPYSLRALGLRLHEAGAHVLGLRLPGHGTVPSGLVRIDWRDLEAAVRIGIRHLAAANPDRPLLLLGYSTGAALAVSYTLDSLTDASLPRVSALALVSPAIGVTPAAALAVWQARLGRLLGLEKLGWNAIQPEYDPYKYMSFAVNAGDVVYRGTERIRAQIDALGTERLEAFPPVLAFSSVVDATVSAPALVTGLFDRLPTGGHELVLFDINRRAELETLLSGNPTAVIESLLAGRERPFALSVVSNVRQDSMTVAVRRWDANGREPVTRPLGLAWPTDVYALAHVSLPFPPDDPVYGLDPAAQGPGRIIHLGNVALRGERGVLQVPASDQLRLRCNPFYGYVEERVLDHFHLELPIQR